MPLCIAPSKIASHKGDALHLHHLKTASHKGDALHLFKLKKPMLKFFIGFFRNSKHENPIYLMNIILRIWENPLASIR